MVILEREAVAGYLGSSGGVDRDSDDGDTREGGCSWRERDDGSDTGVSAGSLQLPQRIIKVILCKGECHRLKHPLCSLKLHDIISKTFID